MLRRNARRPTSDYLEGNKNKRSRVVLICTTGKKGIVSIKGIVRFIRSFVFPTFANLLGGPFSDAGLFQGVTENGWNHRRLGHNLRPRSCSRKTKIEGMSSNGRICGHSGRDETALFSREMCVNYDPQCFPALKNPEKDRMG